MVTVVEAVPATHDLSLRELPDFGKELISQGDVGVLTFTMAASHFPDASQALFDPTSEVSPPARLRRLTDDTVHDEVLMALYSTEERQTAGLLGPTGNPNRLSLSVLNLVAKELGISLEGEISADQKTKLRAAYEAFRPVFQDGNIRRTMELLLPSIPLSALKNSHLRYDVLVEALVPDLLSATEQTIHSSSDLEAKFVCAAAVSARNAVEKAVPFIETPWITKVTEFQATITQMDTDIASLQAEIASQKLQLDADAAENQAKQTEIDTLSQRVSSLENELAALKSSMQAAAERLQAGQPAEVEATPAVNLFVESPEVIEEKPVAPVTPQVTKTVKRDRG